MTTFLIVLPILLAILVIIIVLQPADYKVSRSTTIKAPADAIFTQINDLHEFVKWSPWAKVDANCKYTFEGPATGVGSSFSWAGNAAVGAGKMTIVESRSPDLVAARLDFFKPFAGVGEANFSIKPQSNETVVTWTMTGQKVFITKAIGLVMSMDKMLGGQFEQGLANLKSQVEARHTVLAR